MKIMLSCGNNTKKVINTIAKLADGIDYHYYKNIKEFIKESKLRKLAFKRIIFSETFLSKKPEEDFNTLGDYIKDFSEGTEVVFILKQPTPDLEEKFLAIFNSPLYTLVYLPKPTPNSLIEIITGSMSTVKAKFYELDKGKAKENIENSGEQATIVHSVETQPEVTEERPSTITTASNTTDGGEDISSGAVNPYSSDEYSIVSNNGFSDNTGNSENDENYQISDYSENGSYSDGSSNDYPDYLDSDDLSVGVYGGDHSDTTDFDEDDEGLEELKAHKANQDMLEQQGNVLSEPVQEGVLDNTPVIEDISEPEAIESPALVQPKPVKVEQPIRPVRQEVQQPRQPKTGGNSNIIFVTALNGAGATQWIIDRVAEGASSGKKILVIDMDYMSNGVLSFIDVQSFYNQGCEKGQIYTEDGVDFISQGYGCNSNTGVLKVLKNKSVLQNYDAVFVDCPVECLSAIPDELLSYLNLYICSLSDISKVIELSSRLTSRDYVSLPMEIALMQPAKVIYTDGGRVSDEDKDYVTSLLLMPNGCWFD